MIESHLDETGQPCSRHAPISEDVILAYAAVGSRISGFHHDTASKLQSLMMAVDEIAELASGDIRAAAQTALTAVKDLHELLTVNRALAKAPQRRAQGLRELVTRSADRHGVKIRGELPDLRVQVALPSIAHALSIPLDLAAGLAQHARTVDVVATARDTHVALALDGAGEAANVTNANELIALATFLLRREDGNLTCTPRGFVVSLPLAK